MRGGRPLPGPPPSPLPHLQARTLPAVTLATGSVLSRIHRSALGALYYGPRTDPAERMRWDSPDDRYGVCYAAVQPHIAFAETLLRDVAVETVSEAALAMRSLAEVEVLAPLRLVKFSGAGLHRVGATAAIVHGPYDVPWAWSKAIYDHPGGYDGIRYRARHDDSSYSVALFDRAGPKVRAKGSVPLMDARFAPTLARWLARYELGLASS